jgi:DNA-binding NarL/FixJ family response regulator
MSIRVVLVEDHRIVRDGLRALLDGEAGMDVVAEAGDGRSAVRVIKEMQPQVVVMDVVLPDLNGIEATRKIIAEVPGTRVVALSMYSDKRFVTEMLRAGAHGYLLKDCAFDELARAIRAVAGGRSYLGSGVADVVVEDYVQHMEACEKSAFSVLTPREREVLQLLAEGKSTKEIAADLHVSPKTVETHRQQTMKKLGMKSVAELTKYAIREGLTSLDS